MKNENIKITTNDEWDLIRLSTDFTAYHPCTGVGLMDEEQGDNFKKLYSDGLSLFSFYLGLCMMPDFLLLINQAFEPCLNEEKCEEGFIAKKKYFNENKEEFLKEVQSLNDNLKEELKKEDSKFVYQFVLDCIVLAQSSEDPEKDEKLETLSQALDINKADFKELKNLIKAMQEKDTNAIKDFKILGLDYLAYLGKFFKVEGIDFKEHSWLFDKAEEEMGKIALEAESLQDRLKEFSSTLGVKEKTLIAGTIGLVGVGLFYGAKKLFGSDS